MQLSDLTQKLSREARLEMTLGEWLIISGALWGLHERANLAGEQETLEAVRQVAFKVSALLAEAGIPAPRRIQAMVNLWEMRN